MGQAQIVLWSAYDARLSLVTKKEKKRRGLVGHQLDIFDAGTDSCIIFNVLCLVLPSAVLQGYNLGWTVQV